MTNVLEILKKHPKITEVYTPITGRLELIKELKNENILFPICLNLVYPFTKEGKISAIDTAECIIFPSKEMRDWEKVNWKQGDILEGPKRNKAAFINWASKDFTKFIGIDTHGNYQEFNTNSFNYIDISYPKNDLNNKEWKFEVTIREIESK